MRITICGPNLRDQSRGQFHVHAADCGDLTRRSAFEPEYRHGWTVNVKSMRDATIAVYQDQIAEGASYASCRADLHFFPCCGNDLPEGGDDAGDV